MFYLLKSNKAFNRTSAHPADSAVRIAHHEDDLAALHYKNKVRAVIFKRALPESVIDELQHYTCHAETRKTPDARIWGQRISMSPFGSTCTTHTPFMSRALQEAPALIADIFHVSQAFYRASGRLRLSMSPGVPITEWFMSPETKIDKYTQLNLSPHMDGEFPDGARMTCGYAEDPQGMGTGWFPGTFNRAEVRLISEEYNTASNQESILEKYQYQTTDAGDLLYFRTESPDKKIGTSLSLFHKAPTPPMNKPRLCLLLST